MVRIAQPHNGASVIERRRQVKVLFDLGSSVTEIARDLSVTRKVVATDFKSMGLSSFSTDSEANIRRTIRSILYDSHRSGGRQYLEAQLQQRGIRVQRRRIRTALVQLNRLRLPPRRIRRLPWYEAFGSDGSV